MANRFKNIVRAIGRKMDQTSAMTRARSLNEVYGFLPTFKRAMDGKENLTILTMGAGPEAISAKELAKNNHVIAVELDGTKGVTKSATDKGSLDFYTGQDAGDPKLSKSLGKGVVDYVYETHGAMTYSPQPDRVLQNEVTALKKGGQIHISGGGEPDNWALTNKVILPNGKVVNYIEWLNTIPGT